MSSKPKLVLGSASPRRKSLLQAVGCEFDVEIADIDETVHEGEQPEVYVRRVAQLKAERLRDRLGSTVAILSADTVVASGSNIFGKPLHQQHALEMWLELSGAWHNVISSVCLVHDGELEQQLVATEVKFAELEEQQMALYWQSGEPQDKAGGYAIQGLASAWVQEVRGSYSNVVGLPLFETNQLLRRVGHNWL
jgi:septum formation protein